MKIPNYFSKWFLTYGWLPGGWDMVKVPALQYAMKEVAWRAYRKGVADTKAKCKNQCINDPKKQQKQAKMQHLKHNVDTIT